MLTVVFLVFLLAFVILLGYVLERTIMTGKETYPLLFLICFLPFYGNSLVLSYQQVGSPVGMAIFQYSKEIVLLLALAAFIFFKRNIFFHPFHLGFLDILFLLFLGLSTAFLVLPIGTASFLNKAIYFKNIFLMCLLYFYGRNSQLSFLDIKRGLKLVLAISVIAFSLSLFEKVTNTHIHTLIGLGKYNLELKDKEPTGHYGLTWSFQAQDGKKRFGSIFANPLEFAATTLLTFTIGLALLISVPFKQNKLIYALLIGISILNLLTAYSRASLAAFLGMLFFMAILFRFYKLIGLGFVAVVSMILYLIYFAPKDTQYFVLDTLTFQNPSSIGHALEWFEAIDSMISSPQGIGLASSGNAGGVDVETKVGGENQYLIYGVQLGVVGMLLYIAMLLVGIRQALLAYRRSQKQEDRVIPLIAASVKFGLLLPLFTSNAESYLFVSFVTWWMIGYASTQYHHTKPLRVKSGSLVGGTHISSI